MNRWSHLFEILVTISALLMLSCVAARAQGGLPTPRTTQPAASSYENNLRSAATKLVAQLERAGHKTGTVLDFTDLQGQGTELGRFLAQELSDQLVSASTALSIVDRANLQHLLRENKLSMDGLISPETSRKLGNMIGVDAVIMGTVTPIGESIRLSVRAVAIETGKIVASQSTTIPIIGDLGQLYTRGLSAAGGGTTQLAAAGSSDQKKAGVRDRLRADSFKISSGELMVSPNFAHVSFSIQNRSGIGVGIAVRGGATSAGPCRVEEYQPIRGLAVANDRATREIMQSSEPEKLLRWLPPNANASVSIPLEAYQCANAVTGLSFVPLTVNFVVAAAKEAVVIPLTVERVPVRRVQN